MYVPQRQTIEYIDIHGNKTIYDMNWDSSLDDFVKQFYLILRKATFTHKTAKAAFAPSFRQDL